VRYLLDAARKEPGKIVVPTHNGRRGHPTVFAWKHAAGIDQIPDGQGPSAILKRHAADVLEVAVSSDSVLLDLDTPSDYEKLCAKWDS
jgi:molybdenum cofactor cytidylyltransferase